MYWFYVNQYIERCVQYSNEVLRELYIYQTLCYKLQYSTEATKK